MTVTNNISSNELVIKSKVIDLLIAFCRYNADSIFNRTSILKRLFSDEEIDSLSNFVKNIKERETCVCKPKCIDIDYALNDIYNEKYISMLTKAAAILASEDPDQKRFL